MYYIYIVRCRVGSLYTGIAADIEKRMRQHLARGATLFMQSSVCGRDRDWRG